MRMRKILSRKSIFRLIKRQKTWFSTKIIWTWMKHYLSSRKYDGYIEYIINPNLLAFVRRGWRGASSSSGGWLRLLQQQQQSQLSAEQQSSLLSASFCCGLVASSLHFILLGWVCHKNKYTQWGSNWRFFYGSFSLRKKCCVNRGKSSENFMIHSWNI